MKYNLSYNSWGWKEKLAATKVIFSGNYTMNRHVEKFEEHFADETDEFFEFVEDYGYDRDDDWFSDRKGGYEVEWSFVEE